MANTETQAAGAAAAEAADGGLLDQILTQSKIARSDTERTRARDLIAELVSQVSDGAMVVSKDAIGALDARIAEIDRVLSEQLSSVMHAPEFQQLEGSWRGLKYLVDNSETSTNLKIKVFNTTKKELVKDFKSASDFDQSTLFKKLYEEEYGTFGGAPFATLIGDFEFGRHPEDMYLVEEISHVCAAAHAPFLSAASPELLGFDDFTELVRPTRPGQDLRHRRIRQVEELPRLRGLPLRRPGDAARARPPAVRPGHRSGRGVQLRRAHRRHRPQQVPVDERRVCAGHQGHRRVRQVRLVRGDPRRRGRRPGRRPADPHLRVPTTAKWR
jgi:hypothetical protein